MCYNLITDVPRLTDVSRLTDVPRLLRGAMLNKLSSGFAPRKI